MHMMKEVQRRMMMSLRKSIISHEGHWKVTGQNGREIQSSSSERPNREARFSPPFLPVEHDRGAS
jgi:hypothetical protein